MNISPGDSNILTLPKAIVEAIVTLILWDIVNNYVRK